MLYHEFGFSYNTLHSFEFEGESGFHHMQAVMDKFRSGPDTIADKKVATRLDYGLGIDGLPKSNVLKILSGRRLLGSDAPLRHRTEIEDLFISSGV